MDENSNWDLRHSNLTIVQIVAAIGVIFSHSYRIGVGGKEPLSEVAFGKCTCGTIAVAVFLFLSGFCVSQSYSSARGSIKTAVAELYNFVIRRFLRIFPVVAFAIVVCTFCLGPFVSSLSTADYFSHPLIWRYLRGIWLHSFHATPIWIWTPASDLSLAFVGFYILLYLIFRHPVGWLQKLPPISFGIFVFGFPVQQTFAHFWGGKMPHWTNFFLSLAVVIPIALFEYWTIERPMKMLSRKLFIKVKSHEQN